MTNIIVVDFDDTLCIHGEDKSKISDGKPNIELISRLNELSKKGFEIHIYTARGHISAKNRDDAEKKYRQIIIDWLQRYNVIYAKISFQKPFAVYYIDDKAIRPDELHLLDNLN